MRQARRWNMSTNRSDLSYNVPVLANGEQDDISMWSPRRWEPCWPRFDTIYFDIWPDIHISNIVEASRLRSRAKGWLAPGGWIGDWDTEVRLFDGRKF
jgi:hypothetical protein